DPLDVDALPLRDREQEIDSAAGSVPRRAWAYRREGKPLPRGFDGHIFDGLFHRLGIVHVAGIGAQLHPQQPGIVERANRGLHVDRSDAILLALFDGEGDHETPTVRIVFRNRGDDAYVDEPVLEIEPTQQLAIGLDPVRIINVAGLQERQQQSGLGGLDHVLEPVGRIGEIADKLDQLDSGLYTFGDFEDEIDAVVRQLDDLRFDVHVETAAAAVDLDDASRVGLHDGTRERPSFLGLDFRFQLFILALFVALKRDAVDDRIFGHGDDQASALNRRPDILKQAGGNEGLHAFVDLEGIQLAAWSRPEIGADGVGLDP